MKGRQSFFLGITIGLVAGAIVTLALVFGPTWWKPLYWWQSLIAGCLAIVAALIAYLGIEKQIAVTKKIAKKAAKQQRKEKIKRELSRLAVDAALTHAKFNRSTKLSPDDHTENIIKFLRTASNLYSLMRTETVDDIVSIAHTLTTVSVEDYNTPRTWEISNIDIEATPSNVLVQLHRWSRYHYTERHKSLLDRLNEDDNSE